MRFISPSFLCLLLIGPSALSQTPDAGAAPLREIHADGLNILTEAQLIQLSGLNRGAQVSKKELQASADTLVNSGLFSKVGFNFQSRSDGVYLTFHLVEAPRLPAYFDNIPWFSDAELGDAVRAKLPFFNGTLPEAGSVVDQAAEAIKAFLAAHSLNVAIEHQAQPNPLGDGSVQAFRIAGAALKISQIEFGDPQLAASKTLQAHLAEIINKPYSRVTIDVFLSEQVRPLYQQQGFLRAKLGPPEVHLSGNPNQKLPEQIPVFVPVTPGPVYHWKGAEFNGNATISSITLTGVLGLKPGDVANGVAIEGAWQRISEEYGRRGYLECKIAPVAFFDDDGHTVSYSVGIQEGIPYRFHTMLVTGISLAGERLIRQAWPIKEGQVFDKKVFEQLLTDMETHHQVIFKDLPVHYTEVGHWLQTNPTTGTVDILLDFK